METPTAIRQPEVLNPQTGAMRLDPRPRVLDFSAVERPAAAVAESPTVHRDMHPGVYKAAVIAWAVFMAVFWLTFWVSANALFMVVISTAYALMFFGVPYAMTRVMPRVNASSHGMLQFLCGKVDTLYGPIDSFEALIQVILVPAALSLGGTAMGFIIHAARAAH